ncbi:helix-turn-helix domain-containing protein [Psychrobacter celer]|uniref:helix-turn-helix domain-containing protein n=1 Tax=Psychrobacter celer TaxID=306572 RepID=UPI003FD18DB2
MENSSELILVALQLLGCNQKTLAEKLDVSPTQITKWKNGEYMSIDMRKKLEGMLGLDDIPSNMVLMSGSVENATEWMSLIYCLASLAEENSETGYYTTPLIDGGDLELLGWSTFYTLNEMGVTLPNSFPDELKNMSEIYDDDGEEAMYLIATNPYSSLIYNIYLNLNDVYGFYAAYIKELMYREELDLFDTAACNIESGLLDLAASKLDEEDTELATNFRSFEFKVKKDFEEWLNIIKHTAIQYNVPLRAEMLDMVYKSAGALGHHAERESLGINKGQLHPDIYMNELLVGMRTINLVLPLILEKLDIDIDKDFDLD